MNVAQKPELCDLWLDTALWLGNLPAASTPDDNSVASAALLFPRLRNLGLLSLASRELDALASYR